MGNKSVKEAEEEQKRNARQSVRGPIGQKLAMVHRELRSLPDEFFENCKSVTSIDVSHNKLTDVTVQKFSDFESLTTLILDDNRYSSFLLPYMPKLTFLSLNNNQIKELESIVLVLSTRCPEIQTLSLVGNPCVPSYEFQCHNPQAYNQYRLYIIGFFKSLKLLDFTEIDAQERESAVQLHEDISEGVWKLSSLFPEDTPIDGKRGKKDKKEEKKKEKKEKKKKRREREKEREKERAKKAASRKNGKKGVASEEPVEVVEAVEEEVVKSEEEEPSPSKSNAQLSFPEFDAPPPPPPVFDERQGIDWSSDESSSGDSDTQLNHILAASSVSLRMAASTVSMSSIVRKQEKSSEPSPPPPPPPQDPDSRAPPQGTDSRAPPPKPDPSQIVWSSDDDE